MAGIRTGPNDVLVITAWSVVVGATFVVHFSIIRPNGVLEAQRFDRLLGSVGAAELFSFIIGSGELVSVVCSIFSVAVLPNDVLIQAVVERGRVAGQSVIAILFRDYVTSNHDSGWPGSPILHPPVFSHHPIYQALTDPASGVEWSFQAPTGASILVFSVSFILITGAAVANRFVRLRVSTSGVLNQIYPPAAVQLASTTVRHSHSQSGSDNTVEAASVMAAVPLIAMLPDDILESVTTGLQAADAFTLVRIGFFRAAGSVFPLEVLPE